MAISISACIMTGNEAAKISRALDSLAWASEILVVDSGSTDGTAEIARCHPTKPRVIVRGWPGYRAQREFMVANCVHPWVFMLDADEEVSAELAGSIQALKEGELKNVGIVTMPRRNYIGTRYVRCWSPDVQKRLIHRERMTFDATSQFDTWRVNAGFEIRRVRGAIEHNRLTPADARDFSDAGILAERAVLMGTYLYNNGKRAGFWNLLLRPPATFFKYYVLKGAFLDGRFGLAIAYKTTMGVMAKYSALYGMEVANGTPDRPVHMENK